jgi:hypothetical protein
MNRIWLFLSCLTLIGCASQQKQAEGSYFGLTQAQLAAKVGFPLRVFTLPAQAQGGPGILFWVYYQKAPDGTIEEKQFSFSGTPLKVNSTAIDIVPSRFLSLERTKDFHDIYRYNAAHGL